MIHIYYWWLPAIRTLKGYIYGLALILLITTLCQSRTHFVLFFHFEIHLTLDTARSCNIECVGYFVKTNYVLHKHLWTAWYRYKSRSCFIQERTFINLIYVVDMMFGAITYSSFVYSRWEALLIVVLFLIFLSCKVIYLQLLTRLLNRRLQTLETTWSTWMRFHMRPITLQEMLM